MAQNRKITPKQERFAQLFVEYRNASKAYRESYNAENMKDTTLWEEARRVKETPVVSQRIDELMQEFREELKITREYITQELLDIIACAKSKEENSAAIKGITELAKMYGLVDAPVNNFNTLVVNEDRQKIVERFLERQQQKTINQ